MTLKRIGFSGFCFPIKHSTYTADKTHSTPEFSMGLETDISVFSTTIPKRCEVFSSLSARIRRGFGEDFFEVRAPKMQLALRLEFLEIRTGRYIPES